MLVGRELSVWGWCRNKPLLADPEGLECLLNNICRAIDMDVLDTMTIDVPMALAKLGKYPREDEGGSSAVKVASTLLSTSHAAIHGWPQRAHRADGGLFLFGLQSCRDFSTGAVLRVLRVPLEVTELKTSGGLMEL